MLANRISQFAPAFDRVGQFWPTATQQLGAWLPVPVSLLAVAQAHATLLHAAHAAAVAKVANRQRLVTRARNAYRWN